MEVVVGGMSHLSKKQGRGGTGATFPAMHAAMRSEPYRLAVCSDRAVLVLACKLESGADAVCSDRAEELLLEAHSTHEEHVWWVDLCFFVGFLGSFIMEKYSRS